MDTDHYVMKLKEHEANKTSTNDRNKYWREYNELVKKQTKRKNHTGWSDASSGWFGNGNGTG